MTIYVHKERKNRRFYIPGFLAGRPQPLSTMNGPQYVPLGEVFTNYDLQYVDRENSFAVYGFDGPYTTLHIPEYPAAGPYNQNLFCPVYGRPFFTVNIWMPALLQSTV